MKYILGSLTTIGIAFLGCYMYEKGLNDSHRRWNK